MQQQEDFLRRLADGGKDRDAKHNAYYPGMFSRDPEPKGAGQQEEYETHEDDEPFAIPCWGSYCDGAISA